VTNLPAYGTYLSTLHLMGYYPAGLLPSLKALILTAILFLGPLFEAGIVEGSWRTWVRLRGISTLWHDLPTYRNLVAGPVTEELLFRSASLPLFLLSPATLQTTFLVPPLVFGLAHIHHIYEFRVMHPSVPLLHAVLRSVIQLLYTTLFGSYATFLYLRTGSLLTVILCHAFCNWMGLPRFWGRVEGGGAESVMGPDSGGDQGKRDESEGPSSRVKLGIFWTIAYYTLLVIGAVGFYKYLWVLTESGSALLEF
jgi:prenyl protein peptidase